MSAAPVSLDHGVDQASRLREVVARAPVSTGTGVSPPAACACVAIASGKGGVGKTMLAVNLSAAMAAMGGSPLLLDADVGLANADVACGLAPSRRVDRLLPWLDHAVEFERQARELSIPAPGGFRLLPGLVGDAHRQELEGRSMRRIVERLRAAPGMARPLVIDHGAGLGGVEASASAASGLLVIVCTPDPASMADAYALIKSVHARRGELARMCIVVNQAATERAARRAGDRVGEVAARFLNAAVPLLGWIPRDARVGEAVQRRELVVLRTPRAPASRAIQSLAASVLAWLEDQSPITRGDSAPKVGYRPVQTERAAARGLKR